MKLVRFQKDDKAYYGFLNKDKIYQFNEQQFDPSRPVTAAYPQESVQLLAPCVPTKIIGVGLNYFDHAKELGYPVPKEPLLFIKPSTSAIGPMEPIRIPAMSEQVDYEAELAVVIGRKAQNITPDQVENHIMGYTCFNDVTARDLQKKDVQFTRSKSFNTFAPFGPWIETECDPTNLKVESYLNGELKQSTSTDQLIFGVKELISFISRIMTLIPGDVITTGTPYGVGSLTAGDTVEIRIEGIGSLFNPVIADS
jgi:2-keto-4-pentenoate hydratase/2-oxohepta-3-ene-1,7-dioic acid hydratase in catechol pathway